MCSASARGAQYDAHPQPSTRTIIVQLGNSDDQDFPFRRIATAVNGTKWSYPRSIPRQVLLARAAGGIDSARTVFRAFTAEMAARPGSFHLWPQTLHAAAEEIALAGKRDDDAEILRWCRERFPAEAVCTAPLPSRAGGRCANGQPTASAAHLRPLTYRCRGAGEGMMHA